MGEIMTYFSFDYDGRISSTLTDMLRFDEERTRKQFKKTYSEFANVEVEEISWKEMYNIISQKAATIAIKSYEKDENNKKAMDKALDYLDMILRNLVILFPTEEMVKKRDACRLNLSVTFIFCSLRKKENGEVTLVSIS